MKHTYITPEIKVRRIQTHSILAGSPDAKVYDQDATAGGSALGKQSLYSNLQDLIDQIGH